VFAVGETIGQPVIPSGRRRSPRWAQGPGTTRSCRCCGIGGVLGPVVACLLLGSGRGWGSWRPSGRLCSGGVGRAAAGLRGALSAAQYGHVDTRRMPAGGCSW